VVKSLAWEDAFAILGRSDIALLRKHYYEGSPLRGQLSPESQTFWDGRVGKDFNFMYSGTSGAVAWVVLRVAAPVLGLGFIRRFLLAGASKVLCGVFTLLIVRSKLYTPYFAPMFMFLRTLFVSPTHLVACPHIEVCRIYN